ncbi:hypothetical protein T265_01772 [Opisthorchis viverrini]|uniref:Uncharacterized protein n=1 Tax=Opisthorchis viverrini TaxID=6198 RepID=A0A075A1R3_OPIVI|nr:hypothetical protein T265_01772 [Opisthorchis viverrini]KER32157.1 hypothetical protein T265_01772 [Opisthorchis viverrini]
MPHQFAVATKPKVKVDMPVPVPIFGSLTFQLVGKTLRALCVEKRITLIQVVVRRLIKVFCKELAWDFVGLIQQDKPPHCIGAKCGPSNGPEGNIAHTGKEFPPCISSINRRRKPSLYFPGGNFHANLQTW